MDQAAIQKFVDEMWDDTIVPELVEYIKIPAKSPMFDPDWEANGYMQTAVELLDACDMRDILDITLSREIGVLKARDETLDRWVAVKLLGSNDPETLERFSREARAQAAAADDIDLLDMVLADVAGPQLAGVGVEAHAPGVAHAVGPDLAARAGDIHERVVDRDTIVPTVLVVIDIDSQNR